VNATVNRRFACVVRVFRENRFAAMQAKGMYEYGLGESDN